MSEYPFQILSDGRVFVDYGPVTMVIMAIKKGVVQTKLCSEAALNIPDLLAEISEKRHLLSQYSRTIDLGTISSGTLSGLPLEMVKAVKRLQEPTLTPMATVAGALSDALADWLDARDVDKVIVNNGGDVAIRLRENQSVKMGILPNVETGKLEKTVTIRVEDGIGGVCTSGLGGRSFTRGIANAVTVFAKRCCIADACATHIANASYIKSENVITDLAGNLYPDSDIDDLEVVTQVKQLSREEVIQSLDQIKNESLHQFQLGNLQAVYADVGGVALQWEPNDIQ
ncbi:UPF0280 family protein [Acetobacterium bakii]|uniref:FAD:protein FMN transferase n=1 Tax=Acetobacterium bakii TaxID=52689 RepID=A0A0L6U5M5_9FIRM|nr:FAD:protein FMN transferase [Acetobacterium bakii]KNZ43637.1 hypothetical protein AKG39_00200 [Acetobacterium bakii]